MVILSGPFLSKENKSVKENCVYNDEGHLITFSNYRDLQFQNFIKNIRDSAQVDIKIVPDCQECDILYPYPIPHDFSKSNSSKTSYLQNSDLSSPCLFSLDGKLNIAVSNGDLLKDVVQNAKESGTGNKISSCIETLVSQKNLYPINPTANPFDLTKINELNFVEGQNKPHLWFMPSKLKKFAEVIYYFSITKKGI